MALKWILGNFKDGSISESNVLPVINDSGDTIEMNINAEESATLTVSLKDLPSDWRSYLKVADKMVTLYDDSLAWGSAVIWSGFINKVSATVNGTVKIQATGLKEYISSRIISNTYNSTVTDNKAAIKFSSSTDRGILIDAINACFSYTGSSSSDPRPPSNITKTTNYSGSKSVNVLLSDFQNYGEFCDEWRDEISDNGNEYVFNSSFSSSSKTKIQWSYEVATDSNPHIKENSSLSISLDDNSWKPISFDQSSSTDEMISRIIGQSKEGKDGKGADYQTRTSTSGTNILFDESWNPGVELTQAQMTSNLSKRLNYNSKSFKEAEFETVYNDISDLKTLIGHLGKMVTFDGVTNTASQFFGLTMRIVGVAFNPSNRVFRIELAPQSTRYPQLPKDRRTLKKKSKNRNSGHKKPKFDSRAPIVKSPKPGSNGSDVPGGNNGSGIKPPAPPTPPPFSNDKDSYEDDDSKVIIENVDKRFFKSPEMLANEKGTAVLDEWHPYPSASIARINPKTGEVIGPNTDSRNAYMLTAKNSITRQDIPPLKIYSFNIKDAFNRDNDPYKNERARNIYNPTPADSAASKKLVGEIPFSLYSDIMLPAEDVANEVPVPNSGINDAETTEAVAGFEYIFFTTADFKTLYVQIVFSFSRIVSRQVLLFNPELKYYTSNLSKVLKGERNEEGKVVGWESLGQAFTKDANGDNPQVFQSRNIYEINGEFQAFGGYFFPMGINGEVLKDDFDNIRDEINNLPIMRKHSLKYSTSEIFKINPESDWTDEKIPYTVDRKSSKEIFNKQDSVDGLSGEHFIKSYDIPLSTTVDYINKKVYIGINNDKLNKTVYYSSEFKNDSYSFSNVMDTNRLPAISGYENDSYIKDNKEEYERLDNSNFFPFHISPPLVEYKKNYLIFYTSTAEGISSNIKLNDDEIKLALPGVDKFLNYLRTKNGYQDVVKGKLKNPETPSSISSATVDQVLIYHAAMNNAANRALSHNRSNQYRFPMNNLLNEGGLTVGGMNYMVDGNYIYFIFDIVSQRIDYDYLYKRNRFAYWIGKYKIKETIENN